MLVFSYGTEKRYVSFCEKTRVEIRKISYGNDRRIIIRTIFVTMIIVRGRSS